MWPNHHHNNEWRYKLTKNTSQIMAATKHFLCGEVTDTSCMTIILVSSSFSHTISRYPHRIMHFLPSHLHFHKWILDMYTFDTFPLGILSPLYVREPFDTSCLKNWPLCQLWRGGVWGGVDVCAHCTCHRCGHCIVQCTCALYVLCIACTWHRCGQSLWIFLNVHTVAP